MQQLLVMKSSSSAALKDKQPQQHESNAQRLQRLLSTHALLIQCESIAAELPA